MKNSIKVVLTNVSVAIGVDALFRYVNRNKLLVVMYHGITLNTYNPLVWTHLPVCKFKKQLHFLKEHYSIVSLEQVEKALDGNTVLPPNAAMITFDDGYMNNYEVAFPVLQEMKIPATIFLTVGRIGSNRPLWFDELYLLLHSRGSDEIDVPFINEDVSDLFKSGRTWDAYWFTAEALKRCGVNTRENYLNQLRKAVIPDDSSKYADFCLLGWDDVFKMRDSGLISFGVHTASHRILTELARDEWEPEIKAPRIALEKLLGTPVRAFCFPNGRAEDYNDELISYLKDCGYVCSFAAKSGLFDPEAEDQMQIKRIPAGHGLFSVDSFFRLNCSGIVPIIRDAVHAIKQNVSGKGKP